MKWRDTNDVCVLSTYFEATGTDMVRRKKKIDGKYQQLQVNIPPAIKYYNKNMGGVDLSDQLIQSYAVLRKTRKWWKTLFLHFIDLAVVNSFIILKQVGNNVSQKMFTKYLAKELLENSALLADPKSVGGRPSCWSVRCDHCPVPISSEPNPKQRRLNCKLCYLKSNDEKMSRKPGGNAASVTCPYVSSQTEIASGNGIQLIVTSIDNFFGSHIQIKSLLKLT